MSNRIEIAVCSTVHQVEDPRIFHRQALTLARKFKVRLYICAPYLKKEYNHNLKIIGLPLWEKKVDRIKNIFLLAKYLRTEKAQVYIFHDPELLFLIPFVKVFKRAKIIYDIHENYRFLLQEKLWIPRYLRKVVSIAYIFIEYLVLYFIDMIWYPVQNIGNYYKNNSKVKKLLVPNIPDLSRFNVNGSLPEKEDLLIYLGTMVEDRGIKELIIAFSKIHKKFPTFKFKLIGSFLSENYRQEISKLIHTLALQDKVFLMDKVPYHEIPSILSRAKIGFINYLPTPNNMNTLSNKLFEYLSMKIPVIAPAYPNYKEVLETYRCGVCINPEDADSIAKAIDDLLSNEKLRKEMGERGKKLVDEKYNWEKEAQNLIHAIEEFVIES